MYMLRVLDIVEGTSVDGPGLRSSVYLSGCTHQCPGCHNPQSWDSTLGSDVTVEDLCSRLASLSMNVTFSGGDPMLQSQALSEACRRIKLQYNMNIWVYTGFRFEEVLANESMREVLKWIDVLVDGPFVQRLRDTSLLFRGSSNQRLINVRRWLQTGEVMEWQSDF